jgi:hypothetical protein
MRSSSGQWPQKCALRYALGSLSGWRAQEGESRVFDHGLGAVEAKDCGYGEGGDGRATPDEWPLGVDVEDDRFSRWGEVDAAADYVLPPPAMETLVAETGDDTTVSHEPRAR